MALGGGLLDAVGLDALGANLHPLGAFGGDNLDGLQVRLPDLLGLVVGVADVIADLMTLAANIAFSSHDYSRFRFGAEAGI